MTQRTSAQNFIQIYKDKAELEQRRCHYNHQQQTLLMTFGLDIRWQLQEFAIEKTSAPHKTYLIRPCQLLERKKS